jgi:hypothetical protein
MDTELMIGGLPAEPVKPDANPAHGARRTSEASRNGAAARRQPPRTTLQAARGGLR